VTHNILTHDRELTNSKAKPAAEAHPPCCRKDDLIVPTPHFVTGLEMVLWTSFAERRYQSEHQLAVVHLHSISP